MEAELSPEGRREIVLTHRIQVLPNFPLSAADPLCGELREAGARDFHAAARCIQALPYGRNAERNYRRVLVEGRGTCSSKHAFLAHVARAHAAPVELVIGTYEMDELNTPGVGRVLEARGLSCLLEAHCYLRHDGARVDLTWPAERPADALVLIHEEVIEPEQIADYKPERHRSLLDAWRETSPHARGLSLDALWRIREACIAALGG